MSLPAGELLANGESVTCVCMCCVYVCMCYVYVLYACMYVLCVCMYVCMSTPVVRCGCISPTLGSDVSRPTGELLANGESVTCVCICVYVFMCCVYECMYVYIHAGHAQTFLAKVVELNQGLLASSFS